MTILKGGVIPRCENLPAEIEVAFNIVSSLIDKKLLTIRKDMIGDTPYYLWELANCTVTEEVYGKYYDTAGNLHWTGTLSGEHKENT